MNLPKVDTYGVTFTAQVSTFARSGNLRLPQTLVKSQSEIGTTDKNLPKVDTYGVTPTIVDLFS